MEPVSGNEQHILKHTLVLCLRSTAAKHRSYRMPRSRLQCDLQTSQPWHSLPWKWILLPGFPLGIAWKCFILWAQCPWGISSVKGSKSVNVEESWHGRIGCWPRAQRVHRVIHGHRGLMLSGTDDGHICGTDEWLLKRQTMCTKPWAQLGLKE